MSKTDDADETGSGQTGSGMTREQAERRASQMIAEALNPKGVANDETRFGLPLRLMTGPMASY
jgi:hypothetical protein